MKEFDLRLYVIVSDIDIVKQAIQGGAAMIQLREKNAPLDEVITLGRVLHAITMQYGIPLIINDYVDAALAIGAEGAHVGQKDMPAREARQILGEEKILGVSVSNVKEAIKAQADGADYLGVGPIFETHSKKDAGEPIGLERLREIVQAVSIPVVAIGGISTLNAASVINAGASGIAVISAGAGAENPREAARELKKLLISNY